MIRRLLIIFSFITVITAAPTKLNNTYLDARKAAIEAENLLRTGGHLQLNSRELAVNAIFRKYKDAELARGFLNPEQNAASLHFFKAKHLIDESEVFKFLHKMPKGAVLHTHTSASVSSEWVIKNISYMPDLKRCVNKDGVNILTFRELPEKHKCVSLYVKISDERQNFISIEDYDRALERLINLYTPTPEVEYSSSSKVWEKFQNMFTTISDVLRYLPAYRAFHWQMLQEMYDDNVMYAEVRLKFNELYDANGNIISVEQCIAELINVVEQFKLQYPKFLGIKMIYAPKRNADSNEMRKQFEWFYKLRSSYPGYIIGFDLVGQEDKGKPLFDFVDILKNTSSTYFFHAGETNLYGASTDLNLLDAILLNTTRIGHGYALSKHPVLLNAVKTRNIAVEISLISNQVLHLVGDLHNHPGSVFVSQNIPIVICNDDPGFWNARGLSYDFFFAIMSMAPNNAGLKTLKQLVWNSIEYSMLQNSEKQRAYAVLQSEWDQFIDDVLQGAVV